MRRLAVDLSGVILIKDLVGGKILLLPIINWFCYRQTWNERLRKMAVKRNTPHNADVFLRNKESLRKKYKMYFYGFDKQKVLFGYASLLSYFWVQFQDEQSRK